MLGHGIHYLSPWRSVEQSRDKITCLAFQFHQRQVTLYMDWRGGLPAPPQCQFVLPQLQADACYAIGKHFGCVSEFFAEPEHFLVLRKDLSVYLL